MIGSTDEVYDWSTRVLFISTIVACSCSVCVTLTCFLFKELQQRSFLLILWLAISDLGANATTLLTTAAHDGALCQFQAIFKQFFATAAIIWPSIIALTLYAAVVDRGIEHRHESNLLKFVDSPVNIHCFVWLLSALAVFPPFATHSFGPAGFLLLFFFYFFLLNS